MIDERLVTLRPCRTWLGKVERDETGWDVKRQRPGCISGEHEMDVGLPKGLTGDLDNYLKPISDLLVELRIIDDDRFCRRLSIAKAVTLGRMVVTLRTAA